MNTSRKNAINAGVEHLIHFQERPVSGLSHRKKYGFIITNPPYGERLEEQKSLPEDLYNFRRKVQRLWIHGRHLSFHLMKM